ncbi:MAG: hypothetical protein P9L91_00340, partial [Candidatus Zophobacter franzmannii]|nr:hypothetical protein [Candidatus Zophobacter franzmannii]
FDFGSHFGNDVIEDADNRNIPGAFDYSCRTGATSSLSILSDKILRPGVEVRVKVNINSND